jgi:hypothetical protein
MQTVKNLIQCKKISVCSIPCIKEVYQLTCQDQQTHVFKMYLSVDIRSPTCFDQSRDHHQDNLQGY